MENDNKYYFTNSISFSKREIARIVRTGGTVGGFVNSSSLGRVNTRIVKRGSNLNFFHCNVFYIYICAAYVCVCYRGKRLIRDLMQCDLIAQLK